MKPLRKALKTSAVNPGPRRLRGLAVALAGVVLVGTVTAVVTGGDPIIPPIPAGPFIGAPCQGLGPAAPYPICAVDCAAGCGCGRDCRWEDARFIAWQAYAQGEYVGHARTEHVADYRLRVDDQLDMLYRVTRDELHMQYKLNVGDEVRVESFTDPELNRSLMIQPDGMITLRLLGQIHAAGRTVTQLRDTLDELYKKYYKVPSITVTPTKVNTQLDDLRSVVDRRYGVGGQGANVRVAPDGTISLTAIGYVRAQGLTLNELRQEINERYREKIEGMEIIPVLTARAPRYVYVLGEVRTPGRFEMVGPTTALQALAMAGSWNVGANISQVVVFRRGDDWRLMATMVDLQGALRGRRPCPKGEIWLSDSDVIIVPKGRILEADDFINLVFTRGLYGVFPMYSSITFAKLSSI
ncbi:MAG: polysaccharide biosynthesis/export family protein [Thermoguttaceae bacterium]|jgi:polysaccharide export outer membrane protein